MGVPPTQLRELPSRWEWCCCRNREQQDGSNQAAGRGITGMGPKAQAWGPVCDLTSLHCTSFKLMTETSLFLQLQLEGKHVNAGQVDGQEPR